MDKQFNVGARVLVQPYGMVGDVEAIGRGCARVRDVKLNRNGRRSFYHFPLDFLKLAV